MKSIHEEWYHLMMDSEIVNKLSMDSIKEKETTHQQDAEEQAMMV